MRTELEVLEKRLKDRFVKAFATYHLINDDDHILVALSGGKDSLCLLELLAKRARIQHPRFAVEAVHVRMENIKYETSTDYLQKFCDELGVKLHVCTTRFEIGDATEANIKKQKQPCFLCSWYRRKKIFDLAQELGCNKIALGHHQDDILHTALMNLFYEGRFGTMPALLQMKKMPLQIIRPLCLIKESDIQRYAELRGYQKQIKLCPFEHESNRTNIKHLYDKVEQMNPETRHSLWNALVREGKLIENS
ncbi:tRNA 2-thiocytidine biosynthesis TtcA family protein [Xylanibacter brevis]|uniref:tRNA 2-thiocytidine biosynthesis TtcA family protein n=1 Tax=Xylanibacter brevis TaxID=83231 RepID=UPI0004888425|nr:tRNA 2-thiocytidine biosynthesis TtcA family protein [Xylanibacter brevis]